ncbi:hypothetical protein OHC33_003690 [Knufia fluminis]|uniref:Uncharacterized protein n=1 Tax=Knufia fluminis TaxID=191047 RepID=A0AAN8I8V5_9EURO|nr:hypothetical protein OHC33_003690 [Knufia fluminis]
MAPTELSPNHIHRRSESATEDAAMLNVHRQSSRELSSAAIESERLAQEERRRVASIQEQIQALLAQQKAAEENSKRHTEEAEARQQAAREQSFFETKIQKQADFRSMLPDEIYTRVAGAIEKPEDRDYLRAVIERRTDFEEPTDFKVLMWNAIAGDDADFLASAARKVLACSERRITDADVSAIKSTYVCLRSDLVCPDEHSRRQLSHEEASDLLAPQRRSRSQPPSDAEGTTARPDTSISEHQINSQEHQPPEDNRYQTSPDDLRRRHESPLFKEESAPPEPARNGRRSMMISKEMATQEQTASRQASSTMKKLRCYPSEVDPQHPPHPASVSEKSQAKEPATSPRIKSFVKHIEDMAENDTLQESDFACASCGTDVAKMKDPRIAQCLHLYENKCLTKVRKGHGKGGKVPCAYSGCGKDVSNTANKITNETLVELKEKHLVELGDGTDEEDDDGEKKKVPQDETDAETDDED